MLNDRRLDFKPPTTRGAPFPQGQCSICPRANRASRKTDTRSMLSTSMSRWRPDPRSCQRDRRPARGFPGKLRISADAICCRPRCEQPCEGEGLHESVSCTSRSRATGSVAGHRRYRAAVPPLLARRWARRRTGDRLHFVHGLMHCNKIMSSCCVRIPSFPLDLNGSTVVIGSAGKDHQVATRDLVLAAHHLTDWSDCIDDGCPRRVGHEALQWF
jgi:hypothetical protein